MKTAMNTISDSPSSSIDEFRLQAFVNRTMGDLAAGYVGVMVSIGRQLGLYEVMNGAGPLTSFEVATRAHCAERYVREWLNGQVAGCYLIYHPSSAAYELPPEQALVLADRNSPVYIAPAWEVPASMWADQAKTLEAFRSGGGVP
ncbi:MAG: SAM-dependent methyltransferase PhcB [Verrucomicrobiales bacterium]|nr:SAM-dependent methyltransferase PhcB [Verrucomicrobiales bacterium]